MSSEAASLVARLGGRRVLVVGDLCLDEYLIGVAVRLSREAPVPVLEFRERLTVPGGAANPAHNIVALGSQATLAGVVGEDASRDTLLAQLENLGIAAGGIVTDPQRPTTHKTRVIAQGSLRFPQHLVRIDRLARAALEPALAEALGQRIESLLAQVDAVLISDYRTGVVTPQLADRVRAAARQYGVLTAVDSQGSLDMFCGFDLVRCNAAEAEAQLGWPLRDDHDFERGLVHLQKALGAPNLVVTRGAEGASILARGQVAYHLPAVGREEVFDVTGAGDTVIAVLTLALSAGMDLRPATHLSMAAAGLVVRRLGNAVVTPEELAAVLSVERGDAAHDA